MGARHCHHKGLIFGRVLTRLLIFILRCFACESAPHSTQDPRHTPSNLLRVRAWPAQVTWGNSLANERLASASMPPMLCGVRDRHFVLGAQKVFGSAQFRDRKTIWLARAWTENEDQVFTKHLRRHLGLLQFSGHYAKLLQACSN